MALNEELLRAVELALVERWEDAHRIVQQHEDDTIAAWIHAVLHKIEGDPGNSRYWYHRAGRLDHIEDEPHQELLVIQTELRDH